MTIQIANRDFTIFVRFFGHEDWVVEVTDLYQAEPDKIDHTLDFHDRSWGYIKSPALTLDAGINEQQVEDYLTRLITHISNVRDIGSKLGVPSNLLKDHDLSKFSTQEFVPYVQHHFGNKNNPDAYASAWLHHLHHNPHHWQHWVVPCDHNISGSTAVNGALPMPEPYVREMVADWASFGVGKGESTEVAEWLSKTLSRMSLHPHTKKQIADVLGILDIGVDWKLGRAWVWERGRGGVGVKRFS